MRINLFARAILLMAKVHNLGLFPLYACPKEKPNDGRPYVYTTGYTLEHAIAHYWRVKKWRLSVSMLWSEGQASVALWEDSYSIFFPQRVDAFLYYQYGNLVSDDTELISVPSSELDLVCIGTQTFVIVQSLVKATGGSQAGVAITPYTTGYEYYDFNPVFYEGYLYLPSFAFYITTNTWVIQARPIQGGSVYGVLNYKLPGVSLDIPIYAVKKPGHGGDLTLNVSATLEPEEYWPYDPGDGLGPIYDASSGQELRSPLVTLGEVPENAP